MTTWRVSLSWDRTAYVDVEGCQYAYQAFSLARPLLQRKVAEGPFQYRGRQVSFAECEFRQLGARSAGPGLKGARVA